MNPRARTYGRPTVQCGRSTASGPCPAPRPAARERLARIALRCWVRTIGDGTAGSRALLTESRAERGASLRHSDRVDPDRLDVPALRAATPGCAHRVHLNNAGAALLARPTLEAVMEHLHLRGAPSAGTRPPTPPATTSPPLMRGWPARRRPRRRDRAVRQRHPRLERRLLAIRLRPGDRILTGRAEYGSNVLAYLQVAQRTGAEVVVVPDDESGQLDIAALADLIDERTRLIGISHVPTDGGLVNPAAEIGRVARAAGVLYLLDATQSVGQFPLDVEEIGCDLLTATGRKFLRGPRGTGFLWVRSAALDRLDPHVVEIGSADWDGPPRLRLEAPGARRFATWEHSYAQRARVERGRRAGAGPGAGRHRSPHARARRGPARPARRPPRTSPPTTAARHAARSSPPSSTS